MLKGILAPNPVFLIPALRLDPDPTIMPGSATLRIRQQIGLPPINCSKFLSISSKTLFGPTHIFLLRPFAAVDIYDDGR